MTSYLQQHDKIFHEQPNLPSTIHIDAHQANQSMTQRQRAFQQPQPPVSGVTPPLSAPNEMPKLADNTLNFHAILNGIQTLTTVMIKNIPMRFSQQDLLQMIQQRHADTFDYFYLPMDLKTRYNRGYAYINFTHPLFILDFYLEF